MKLDLPALFSSVSGVLKLLLFLALFLVVRGLPALLLYRDLLARRDQYALALLSATQLPLVLAITTLATAEGHMRASTAAALIGAAVLSTLVFPVLGLRLRGDLDAQRNGDRAPRSEPDVDRSMRPDAHPFAAAEPDPDRAGAPVDDLP